MVQHDPRPVTPPQDWILFALKALLGLAAAFGLTNMVLAEDSPNAFWSLFYFFSSICCLLAFAWLEPSALDRRVIDPMRRTRMKFRKNEDA
jgi:drug/metabolite transporter (DMT)-like permease